MLAIYWTLLTLGPVALGIIIWIFTKVMSFAISSKETLGVPLMLAYFIFPILIECGLLTALYIIVPRVRVKFQDALFGALFVTVVFEVSKKVFSEEDGTLGYFPQKVTMPPEFFNSAKSVGLPCYE